MTVFDCPSILKVLAEPTRFAVLNHLIDGPKTVTELNDILAIEQSLLSHHLKILRDANLVTTKREGKNLRYAVASNIQDQQGNGLDLGCCRLTFNE